MINIFNFLGDCTYRFFTTFAGKLFVYFDLALVNIGISCFSDNLSDTRKVIFFLGELVILIMIELMSVIKNNLERQQKR